MLHKVRILSFDPGGTTGWALYDPEVGTGYNQGQMGPQEHHEQLYGFLELQHTYDLHVVCESFEYRKNEPRRDNIVLVSLEYIGVIKLFCAERNVTLKMQTASYGKAFWSDDNLKKVELYWKGHPHANDAMRHLLAYQTFTLGDKRILTRLK